MKFIPRGRPRLFSTVSHIVNYDLPDDCDDYVHRVGRTGRMGRDGIAFSFVSRGQGELLTEIEVRINRQLIADPLAFEGCEPAKRSAFSTSLIKKPKPVVDVDSVEGAEATETVDGELASEPPAKKRGLNRMRRTLSDRAKRR